MDYTWDFSFVWRSQGALLKGMGITGLLSLTTILLGTLIALPICFMRMSRVRVFSWAGRLYIELFRNLPVLVLLVWLYYCLPLFLSGWAGWWYDYLWEMGFQAYFLEPYLENVRVSPFWMAVLGLGLNFSALQAEIFRSGVEAIPSGEIEVARAFRFKPLQIARHIIVPQAFWRSLAPTLGQCVNTLKYSALASFLAVEEAFYVTGKLMQDRPRPLELYTVLALMYLALILPLSIGMQWMEQKLKVRYGRS